MRKPPALVLFLFLAVFLRAQSREADAAEPLRPEGTAGEAVTVAAAASAAVITEETAPELDVEALLRRLITEKAREYLGTPYKYAGVTPEGFDCTGFIFFVYREAAGMEVSRSSAGIWNSGTKITPAQAQPGDVLVFTTVRAGASHAGIVLENGSGGIIFIHAASQGSKTGVIISSLNENYYKSRFLGARSFF